jgi:hypothetical protein
MDTHIKLIRPHTLVIGETYYLCDRNETSQEPDLVAVKFVAYDACPAFVIVNTGDRRIRCSRDDVLYPLFHYSVAKWSCIDFNSDLLRNQ